MTWTNSQSHNGWPHRRDDEFLSNPRWIHPERKVMRGASRRGLCRNISALRGSIDAHHIPNTPSHRGLERSTTHNGLEWCKTVDPILPCRFNGQLGSRLCFHFSVLPASPTPRLFQT